MRRCWRDIEPGFPLAKIQVSIEVSSYRQGAEKLWAAEVSPTHHGIIAADRLYIDVVNGAVRVCDFGDISILEVDVGSGFVLNFRMARLRLLSLDTVLAV